MWWSEGYFTPPAGDDFTNIYISCDQGMLLNYIPTRACRKTAFRQGYVVKWRPVHGMSKTAF